MALLFLDCCREAYRARGRRGISYVSVRALVDLMQNAPGEHVVELIEATKPVEPTRSCSCCNFEVQPDWQSCKICGMYLNDATLHETGSIPTDTVPTLIEGWRGVNRPWTFRDPR
jgi:hypothetical protein